MGGVVLGFFLKKKGKMPLHFDSTAVCIFVWETRKKKKGSLALNLPIPCLENFLPVILSYSFQIHTASASASAWNEQRFLFLRNSAFTEVHIMCVKIKHCWFVFVFFN